MPPESEWQTRKQRIDTRLKKLGWNIVPFSDALDLTSLDRTAVEELPTENGPADYGLFLGGKLVGIIEAKKVAVAPQNVLEQAKRYAAGVFAAVGEWDGLRVPFLYASNGTLVWYLDTRPARRVSRQISDFHTPDALASRFAENPAPSHDWLRHTPPERIGRLRPYQWHRKALADLISMVKHAAREAEPLLTAEERVTTALAEIRAFHTFDREQSQWLDLIARHLVENLCVDTSDLETQPIFTSKGGLARARRVFGDQLPRLIERLNYTLAA